MSDQKKINSGHCGPKGPGGACYGRTVRLSPEKFTNLRLLKGFTRNLLVEAADTYAMERALEEEKLGKPGIIHRHVYNALAQDRPAGICTTTVGKAERGRPVYISTWHIVAGALGVAPEELLPDPEVPPPDDFTPIQPGLARVEQLLVTHLSWGEQQQLVELLQQHLDLGGSSAAMAE